MQPLNQILSANQHFYWVLPDSFLDFPLFGTEQETLDLPKYLIVNMIWVETY